MNVFVTVGDLAGCSPLLAASLIEERREGETLTFFGPSSLHGFLLEYLDRNRFGRGIEWVEVGSVERDRILSAEPDADTGALAYRSLEEALELSRPGETALLTLPLAKSIVQSAGHDTFRGHTEELEAYFGTDGVMTFFGDTLNVALLTRHIPLREVPDALDETRVEETVRAVQDFYEATGQPEPSFALLGLNPHAGEDGKIGREDEEVLKPAVQALRSDGVNIEGPYPADSFLPVHGGSVDLIFACYHDQGLVPFKQNHFFDGVHATLGLPVMRVSPDHGVALQGVRNDEVNPESTLNCLRWLREHS